MKSHYFSSNSNLKDKHNVALVPSKSNHALCENIQIQGCIEVCAHAFCFSCIERWSLVTNTCPLCKLAFHSISQKIIRFSIIGKTVEVKDKRQESHIEEDFNPGLYDTENIVDEIGNDYVEDGFVVRDSEPIIFDEEIDDLDEEEAEFIFSDDSSHSESPLVHPHQRNKKRHRRNKTKETRTRKYRRPSIVEESNHRHSYDDTLFTDFDATISQYRSDSKYQRHQNVNNNNANIRLFKQQGEARGSRYEGTRNFKRTRSTDIVSSSSSSNMLSPRAFDTENTQRYSGSLQLNVASFPSSSSLSPSPVVFSRKRRGSTTNITSTLPSDKFNTNINNNTKINIGRRNRNWKCKRILPDDSSSSSSEEEGCYNDVNHIGGEKYKNKSQNPFASNHQFNNKSTISSDTNDVIKNDVDASSCSSTMLRLRSPRRGDVFRKKQIILQEKTDQGAKDNTECDDSFSCSPSIIPRHRLVSLCDSTYHCTPTTASSIRTSSTKIYKVQPSTNNGKNNKSNQFDSFSNQRKCSKVESVTELNERGEYKEMNRVNGMITNITSSSHQHSSGNLGRSSSKGYVNILSHDTTNSPITSTTSSTKLIRTTPRMNPTPSRLSLHRGTNTTPLISTPVSSTRIDRIATQKGINSALSHSKGHQKSAFIKNRFNDDSEKVISSLKGNSSYFCIPETPENIVGMSKTQNHHHQLDNSPMNGREQANSVHKINANTYNSIKSRFFT